MTRGKVYGGLMVGLALAVCTGLALAQGPGGPGKGGRGRGPGSQGGPGLMMLFGSSEAQSEITNVGAGVEVKITVDDPKKLGPLQEQVARSIVRLQDIAERERPLTDRPDLGREGGLAGLIMSGAVDVSSRQAENGMVLTFTSDKPEVVQRLQQEMPEYVAQARARIEQFAQMQKRAQQMREALRLLADDAVKIDVKETDNGLVVNVTSTDPEVAKQIKEKLVEYFQNQKEFARRIGRIGGRHGRPEGARTRGQAGGGRRGRRGAQKDRPARGGPQ